MKSSRVTRREFIGSLAAAGVLAGTGSGRAAPNRIDRFALVSRHNPVLRKFEPLSPLSLGNGEFAFTCDVTGLQTFPDLYKDAMPLCTMSQWGWHTNPLPASLKGKTFKPTEYDSYGRKVPYITGKSGQEELYDYLRENPHRLHLGRVGFRLLKADGIEAEAGDITEIDQRLDLWTGIIQSAFTVQGDRIIVRTAVHPNFDALGVSVESELLRAGRLSLRIAFPYGSPTVQAADWNSTDKHTSEIAVSFTGRALIHHKLDQDENAIGIRWTGRGKLVAESQHHYLLIPTNGNRLDVTFSFSPAPPLQGSIPNTAATFAASELHWKEFWTRGAAIELAESKDPRAKELERRIVLSQYLTAIQCSGSTPPQDRPDRRPFAAFPHALFHWSAARRAGARVPRLRSKDIRE